MRDIYGGKDSLTCYKKLLKKRKVEFIEELEELYEVTFRELLIEGHSPFFDLVLNELYRQGLFNHKLDHILVNMENRDFARNIFDKFMRKEIAITMEDTYFFTIGFNYYKNKKIDAFTKQYSGYLFRCNGLEIRKPQLTNIETSITGIDSYVEMKRRELFLNQDDNRVDIFDTIDYCKNIKDKAIEYYNSLCHEAELCKQSANIEAENILANARQKAVDEEENARRTIIQNAHNDADRIIQAGKKQANELFLEAQAEKTKIIENAKKEEEKIIGKAKKRAIEIQHRVDRTCSKNKSTYCDTSFKDIRGRLLELNDSLSIVNGKMKKMEDVVNQQHTQEIYDQLTELYDIIDDVKNFTLQSAQEKDSVDLKNSALNMGEFQDMITEYLESYGIQTIYSVPGEAFNGKYHAVKTKDFDPQNSIVTKSLKIGFMWGDQVMQKEIVEIKNKEL